ncbi:MAG TPA: hypothetical protein VGH19_00545 [Verrucomicrobiae bacterium]
MVNPGQGLKIVKIFKARRGQLSGLFCFRAVQEILWRIAFNEMAKEFAHGFTEIAEGKAADKVPQNTDATEASTELRKRWKIFLGNFQINPSRKRNVLIASRLRIF